MRTGFSKHSRSSEAATDGFFNSTCALNHLRGDVP